jgi:hypothetical protein
MTEIMSKTEREALLRLVRQRNKMMKAGSKQREAELKADFENHMGQEYAYDQDEIWKKAVERVKPEVRKAQAEMAARCRELGIPKEFAPTIRLEWSGRGYGNALESQKQEKRRMAYTRIRSRAREGGRANRCAMPRYRDEDRRSGAHIRSRRRPVRSAAVRRAAYASSILRRDRR